MAYFMWSPENMQRNCGRESNPLDALLAGVMQGMEGLGPHYWPGYEQEGHRGRRAQSVDPRYRSQQQQNKPQGACKDPRNQRGNCRDYRRGYSWIEDAMPWTWWNMWGSDDEDNECQKATTSCQGKPGCSTTGGDHNGRRQTRPKAPDAASKRKPSRSASDAPPSKKESDDVPFNFTGRKAKVNGK